MRISDWSSDVCSSDLTRAGLSTPNPADPAADEAIVVFDGVCALCSCWVGFLLRHDRARQFRFAAMPDAVARRLLAEHGLAPGDPMSFPLPIGRDSCWERACQYVYILFVVVLIKKQIQNTPCTRS